MPTPYSLTDVVERGAEARTRRIWTAFPGIVQSFDPVTCTADVLPATRDVVPVDDDSDETDDLPLLPNIRVLFLDVAAGKVRVPLAEGDKVLVIVLTLSETPFRQTGEVSDPGDNRRHHIGNAVCIPGFVPDCDVTPLTVPNGIEVTSSGPVVVTAGPTNPVRIVADKVRAESPDVRLGIDNEADTLDDFVALATLVKANFDSLASALGAPIAVTGGGGGTVTIPPLTFSDVAAVRTKAR